jgi:hypothetical protein
MAKHSFDSLLCVAASVALLLASGIIGCTALVHDSIVGRPTLVLSPSGPLVLVGRSLINKVSTTGYAASWNEGAEFSPLSDLGVRGPGNGVDDYDAMSILPDGSIAVVTAHGNVISNVDYRNLVVSAGAVQIGPTKGIVNHGLGFCAYPGLVTLPDGNLITGYSCNGATLRTQLSSSQGVTWQPDVTILKPSDYSVDSVGLTLLSNRTIFLAFDQKNPVSGSGNPAYMTGTIGPGDAVTWSAPVAVPTPSQWASCWAAGPVVQLSNGTILWPVWCQHSVGYYSSTVLISTDGGTTWPTQVIVGDGPRDGRNYDESALAVYPNGDVLMILRQTTIEPFGTWWRSISSDGGLTWTHPVKALD